MIKVESSAKLAGGGPYQNFLCGEVLFTSPASYDVCCSLCAQRLPWDSFPKHFQVKHLPSTAPTLAVKVESDPIAQEHYESDEQADVDLEQIAMLDDDAADDSEEHKPELAAEASLDLDWPAGASEVDEMEDDDDDDDYDDMDNNGLEEPKEMLFQCDKCERVYKSKRSLQCHKRTKHSDKPQPPKIVTLDGRTRKPKAAPKIFKCEVADCDQTFRTERDLRGHGYKHTGIFCDICGKPFTQSGNMLRHRQRHSGIKSHKCQEPECEAAFYTAKELNSHKICHTRRMPCICEICGRQCRDRGVLTAHMRRHTGERPAKCKVCDKAFYSFHDLNVHAVSHTNLRPFICDVCGSTFQRKKALRVHKLLHSDQRKYPCKLCNKTFAQSGGLNAHMRTHEPGGTKSKLLGPPQITSTNVEKSVTSLELSKEPTTITMAIELNGIGDEVVANWSVA